jgi:two-component system response regulator RegA
MSHPTENEHPRLLIAEDDERLGRTLSLEFEERDYEVTWIRSLTEFEKASPSWAGLDFAVVDLRLENSSGLTLISELRSRFASASIVVLTGYGSIATAVEAMKRGAMHYLTKPAQVDDIERALWGQEGSSEASNELSNERGESLAQHERDFIESVLLQCDGNITLAAKRLGLHRQSLQRKLRKRSGR